MPFPVAPRSLLRRAEPLLHRLGLPTTKNELNLVRLRGKHRGKRCFIIGNGPSLVPGDLDLIAGEVSIACNKIYLIYDQTKWRPTYYCAADQRVIRGLVEDVPKLEGSTLLATRECADILRPAASVQFPELYDNIKFVDYPAEHLQDARFEFSRNILTGVQGGWTTMFTMLQLAYWMGCDRVFLLGVDHNYPPNANASSRDYRPAATEKSHFAADYAQFKVPVDAPMLHLTTAAFGSAWQVFKADGRVLLNASRRTQLSAVPRIALEDALRLQA